MESKNIFQTGKSSEIEKELQKRMGLIKSMFSSQSLNSPRAVGDSIQDIIEELFIELLDNDNSFKVEKSTTRRSMADLTVVDKNKFTYFVDIKTHNLNTEFNMPNLSSIKRLYDLYKDDNKFFALLFISYKTENNVFDLKNISFFPIEYVNWKSLTIGALGWGQLQILNSNKIILDEEQTRSSWIKTFNKKIKIFYENEKVKIDKRQKYFSNL